MKLLALMFAAAAVTVRPLVDEDVLEPSVRNEVDHALSRAPACSNAVTATGCFARTNSPFCTNGLSRTRRAILLVSAQRADGRWCDGTNDMTGAVVDLLREL